MCPLEKAIYWIEHVIKFKGAQHLKPASLNLTFYENNLLDVVAFLGGILFIVSYISYRIIKKIVRCVFRRK